MELLAAIYLATHLSNTQCFELVMGMIVSTFVVCYILHLLTKRIEK